MKGSKTSNVLSSNEFTETIPAAVMAVEIKAQRKRVRAVLYGRPTEATDKASTNRLRKFLLQRTARNAAQIIKPIIL